MNERHIVTRMGVGDLLTTFDFINGLRLADKARNIEYEYHICYPSDLTSRGEKYCQWVKELHNRVVGDVVMNWGTSHDANLWGASIKAEYLAFTLYERLAKDKLSRNRKRRRLKRKRASWNECLDYIHFIPYPDKICDEVKYIDSNNYAVITTRLRATTQFNPVKMATHFFDYVGPIIDELHKKYEKIVIIGEPEVNPWCDAHKAFKNDPPFPNIYSRILHHVEQNSEISKKIIDATEKEFNMEQFLKENSICRDAKRVVCLGHGGNYARQLYIGSETSCLMTSPNSGLDHPVTMDLMKKRSTNNEDHRHLEKIKIFHENDFQSFLGSL